MANKLFIDLINDKISEYKDTIKRMRVEEGRAQSTINTQTHLKRREVKILVLIKELMEQIKDVKLTADSSEFFNALTCLSENRGGIKVHEGDNLMDILKEHQETRDAMGKIQRACEKAGLTIDYSTGTIVKEN